MIHEAQNAYAENSRLIKAMRLADLLGPIIKETLEGDNDLTVAQCARECLTNDMWIAADKKIREQTDRKSPAHLPSPATRAMVIAILEERYENDVPPLGLATV